MQTIYTSGKGGSGDFQLADIYFEQATTLRAAHLLLSGSTSQSAADKLWSFKLRDVTAGRDLSAVLATYHDAAADEITQHVPEALALSVFDIPAGTVVRLEAAATGVPTDLSAVNVSLQLRTLG